MVKLEAGRVQGGYIAKAQARGKIGDVLVETAFAVRDLIEQNSNQTGDGTDMLADALCAAVKMVPGRKQ